MGKRPYDDMTDEELWDFLITSSAVPSKGNHKAIELELECRFREQEREKWKAIREEDRKKERSINRRGWIIAIASLLSATAAWLAILYGIIRN